MSSTLCRSLTSLHHRGPSRARVEARLCAVHGRRKGLITSRLFHTQVWGYVSLIVSKFAIGVEKRRLWCAHQAVGTIPTMVVTGSSVKAKKQCEYCSNLPAGCGVLFAMQLCKEAVFAPTQDASRGQI